MATQRQERVQELLKQAISDIIRQELDDPHIGFVTLTDVAVSADLRHARVYASVLGDEASRRDSLRALGRAAKFIRGRLAERVDLKFVPQLAFHHDRTAERAQRIESLLREIATERTDDTGASENSEDHSGEELLPPDDAREA